MKIIKSLFTILSLCLILFLAGYIVYNYYPWIFSVNVKGKILDVQRVTNPSAIINSNVSDAQIHSYSVLIQSEEGRLYTASSEDRQWQVAGRGYCVEAKLYRYPPWNLDKAGTFFNARITELKICDGTPTSEVPNPIPNSTPTPTPNEPITK